MLHKNRSLCPNPLLPLACLLVASLVLSACQAEPTSSPSAGAASPLPATSAPVTLPTHTPPSATAAPSIPVETGAAPESTPTSAPAATITASGKAITHPAGTVVMPILLYHNISDKPGTRYTTDTKTFREQMKKLKSEGYETVTISQLADVIRTGGTLPEKPVAITFDDGYQEMYENAFPILRELGYTATVYIITGTLGTDISYGYMQEDALKDLVAAGWEIGSHGVTHTDLMKSKLGAGNEMKQSRETLEKMLGIKVRSFSYPFAAANPELKDLAKENGYDSGVGIDIINTHTPKRLYFLSRREVYRSLPLFGFEKLLVPSKDDDLIATLEAATETPKP